MSPWKLRSIALPTDALIPAAKTVTNTTTASPIISAAGRDRRAARLAHRVLARQAPGQAAQPLQRPADERRQRPHQPRAEHRHAEQRRHGAAADEAGRRVGVADRAEQAVGGHPEAAERRAAPPPPRRSCRGRGPRAARPRAAPPSATRAWPAAPASARRRASRTCRPRPTTMIVRVSITMPVLGRSIPKLLKIAFRPAAKPIPANTPSTAPSSPMIVASVIIPRRICPRVAPSVRSMPELADALGDRDRERVEDQEAAHQQGHAAEHEQDHAEETELVLDVLRLARGGLLPRLDEQARRQHAVDAPSQLLGRDAGRGLDGDPVELALLLGQALGLGQRQLGRARAARRGVAEPLDADDLVGLHARLGRDPQRVADAEVLAVGRRLVERGLARPCAAGDPRRR